MRRFGSITELTEIKLRSATSNVEVEIDCDDSAAAAIFLTPNAASDTLISRISTDTGANRLQNKELSDNSVVFVDSADTTKKLAFEVSGLSSAATRTLTMIDADSTIGGNTANDILTTDATQTLTNKSIDSDTNTLSLALTTLKTTGNTNVFIQRDGSGNAIDSLKAVPSGDVVGTTDAQTLTTKTLTSPIINDLKDNELTLEDDGDATKQFQFQISGLPAAATTIGTLPSATGNFEFVDLSTAQSLTQKTLDEFLYSSSDEAIVGNAIAKGTTTTRRITGTGPLTSISGGVEGDVRILVNETGAELTVTDDSASPTANQIVTGTGGDITLQNNASITVIRDTTTWNVIGGVGGSGGGLTLEAIDDTDSPKTGAISIHYLTDTTNGAIIFNLPAGTANDVIRLSDTGGNWGTNNLTINPDGSETIDGETCLICDVDRSWVQLMWDGTEWVTDDSFEPQLVDLTGPLTSSSTIKAEQGLITQDSHSANLVIDVGDTYQNPSLTISSTSEYTINGSALIDESLTVNGTLTVTGSLKVAEYAAPYHNLTYDVQGDDYTVPPGATLSHPDLTIASGATYTNEGTMRVLGDLTVIGTLVDNGTILNID